MTAAKPSVLTVRVPEAAAMLGTSERTLYRWIDEGKIPSLAVGRVRLIPLKALEEWVERETRRAG